MAKRTPKTIRGFLDDALDPDLTEWKVVESWVSGHPCEAPNTKRIMDFLESAGIEAGSSGRRSLFGNSGYEFEAAFLDGGFRARANEYEWITVRDFLRDNPDSRESVGEFLSHVSDRKSEEGAWLFGPLATLFVARGIGLGVPRSFLESHGLESVCFEELSDRVRWEVAYRATTYVARDGDARIDIRIGERGPQAVDALLEMHDQEEWAYITAWNPRSESTPLPENEEAQERLRETLRREGIIFFDGMSEPDDGSAGEGSLLALVGHERAAALGREFEQNAIVVGGIDREAAILWCAPSSRE